MPFSIAQSDIVHAQAVGERNGSVRHLSNTDIESAVFMLRDIVSDINELLQNHSMIAA